MQLLLLKSGNMIKLHIAEVLQEKGITKTEFARIMGIQKQNVHSLLETNNIRKIEEIAEDRKSVV